MVIDLSKYNTVTDWQQVKESVSGVILRCGYRGYGSGKIVEDAKFQEFATACRQNNIPFGLYFMSQAISAQEGKEEAEYSLAKARECGATLPVFIDSEDGDGTQRVVRADDLPKNLRTEVVKAFCGTAMDEGFQAGVYASEHWYQENLDYSQLKDKYIIWAAKYGKNNGVKSTTINLAVCHMHQYTSKGTIAGIKGYVDLNEGDLKNFAAGKTQNVPDASEDPEEPTHIQLNYKQGEPYEIAVDGLRIRTKKAEDDPIVLPNAEILGVVNRGRKIRNLATARVGGQIWMYIGLDVKGREQWLCADNGQKAYIE